MTQVFGEIPLRSKLFLVPIDEVLRPRERRYAREIPLEGTPFRGEPQGCAIGSFDDRSLRAEPFGGVRAEDLRDATDASGIATERRDDPLGQIRFLFAFGGLVRGADGKAQVTIAQRGGGHTAAADQAGMELKVLGAVEAANDAQKHVLSHKIKARLGDDLTGKHFAVWGLAFKPQTDDMREAPSRTLVADLLAAGATITAYDPAAMPEARRIFATESRLSYAETPMHTLEGADALVIVTEWKEFRSPDFDAVKALLKAPLIFDGRNLYDPKLVRAMGIEYFPIGR